MTSVPGGVKPYVVPGILILTGGYLILEPREHEGLGPVLVARSAVS